MNNLLTRNRTTVLKMKAILMVCLMGVFTVSRFTMHYSLQIQCLHFQLFVFVVIELLLCFVLKIKVGTFTSPVLVLDVELHFTLEYYL